MDILHKVHGVEEFEYKLKEWLDVRYLNTTNSGTSALQLALTLAGVKHNNRVISTPMTCTATNTAIRAVGGQIVWADIDPLTGNIDPNYVEDILRKECAPVSMAQKRHQIKVVMLVHWGGYPCDLDAFNLLSQKYGVKIIEDAAHAFGATYNGRKIGSHSDFVCFSFQAIKHLTTVDGGAVVCREEADWKRGKLLRWFGIDRESPRKDFRCEENVKEAGFKYHMNDVNATIGIHNIDDMHEVLKTHQDNGTYYDKFLKGIPGITLLKRNPNCLSAYWIYTLLADNRKYFMESMAERGISTSQVHSRNDTHDMFNSYRCPLPGVDAFTEKQVNIPVGWWVNKDMRKYIEDTIRQVTGKEKTI